MNAFWMIQVSTGGGNSCDATHIHRLMTPHFRILVFFLKDVSTKLSFMSRLNSVIMLIESSLPN